MKKPTSRIKIAVFMALVVVVGSISGYCFYKKNNSDDASHNGIEEMPEMMGNGAGGGMEHDGENTTVISASGTTYYGTSAQTFNMTFKDDDGDSVLLQVEEVYVQDGAEVTEGTPVYKLTDKSVEKVKNLLDDAYVSAKSIYDNANYVYNKGILEAECEYLKAISLDQTSLAEYELKVENLDSKIAKSQEQVEDAQKILEENPDKLEKLYDDKETYTDLKEEYQEKIDDLKLLLVSAKNKLESTTEAYQTAKTDYEYMLNHAEKATATSSDATAENDVVKSTYEAAKAAYEKAQSEVDAINSQITEYEKNVKTINEKYDYAQKKLDEYYKEYVTADENMESYLNEYETLEKTLSQELLAAENEYDENVYTYTNAKYHYELQLENLKSELEDSISAYEKTKKALEEFEEFCGDGIIRADRDGKIMNVQYFEGRPLTTGDIVTYYDYSMLRVQVSVGQSDISKLNVGDEVIVSSQSGSGTAVIESVKTSASGQGISRVYYTVTICIPDELGIKSGEAVSVYAGINS